MDGDGMGLSLEDMHTDGVGLIRITVDIRDNRTNGIGGRGRRRVWSNGIRASNVVNGNVNEAFDDSKGLQKNDRVR